MSAPVAQDLLTFSDSCPGGMTQRTVGFLLVSFSGLGLAGCSLLGSCHISVVFNSFANANTRQGGSCLVSTGTSFPKEAKGFLFYLSGIYLVFPLNFMACFGLFQCDLPLTALFCFFPVTQILCKVIDRRIKMSSASRGACNHFCSWDQLQQLLFAINQSQDLLTGDHEGEAKRMHTSPFRPFGFCQIFLFGIFTLPPLSYLKIPEKSDPNT